MSLTFSFDPFPVIQTDRLQLRAFRKSDADDVFRIRSNPEHYEFTDNALDKNLDDSLAYIEKMNRGVQNGEWIIWALEHLASHRVIGHITIWNLDAENQRGEVGFVLARDFHKLGLMREALFELIRYGFIDMQLNELEAYTEAGNKPAIRLLERFGFKPVGQEDEQGVQRAKTYHWLIFRLEKPSVLSSIKMKKY